MSLMRREDNGRCLGVVFDGLQAVEVTNVADFFCFVDGCEEQIWPKQRLWRDARKEWTIAMGVGKSPEQGEELKVIIHIDCGRRKRRPSWSQC
eukprot:scaffold13148_cov71-Cyclotella_meneghiniana.AAC.2